MADIGILDTSVVIDLPLIAADRLPDESAITAITLAELAAGPHATTDAIQRSIRQERLQWAEATFDALAFDFAAARSYGRVYALVLASQRQPRRRLADLLIASIAAANGFPLYTRNPKDFAGLDSLISVIAV
jgi:predicted nucleic acid-binding protein